MAADDPRSIVASWDTAHKASMLLGRRERKELCRPRACPENPLELVLVCLNNSTGFFAQTVARFEWECQGTATPCRDTLVYRSIVVTVWRLTDWPLSVVMQGVETRSSADYAMISTTSGGGPWGGRGKGHLNFLYFSDLVPISQGHHDAAWVQPEPR